jgi:hypothetical protein
LLCANSLAITLLNTIANKLKQVPNSLDFMFHIVKESNQ